MGDYSIELSLSDEIVGKMNDGGFKLCFASGVSSGKTPSYNVVAYTTTVANTTTIEWTDTYYMAASKNKLSNGVKFKVQTNPAKVEFGEVYHLEANWVAKLPAHSDKAPKDGFLFDNRTDGASAVVYKMVEGQMSPIYISAGGPLLPGTEKLVPKPSCKIWFAKDTETNTFIDEYETDPIELDLTGLSSVELDYTVTGKWVKTKENKRS